MNEDGFIEIPNAFGPTFIRLPIEEVKAIYAAPDGGCYIENVHGRQMKSSASSVEIMKLLQPPPQPPEPPPASEPGPRPDGYLTAYFALVAAFVRDVGHCPMLVAICKVGYPPYNTVEGAATGIRNAIERHEPAFKGIVWCRNHFSETEFLGVAQPQ